MLGRGAWGSTLANLWEGGGHRVRRWSRRDGGSPLPLLDGCDLVVSALPMAGISATVLPLAPDWPADLPLLSCSKGIDQQNLSTASQLWRHQLSTTPVAVLSGPNLARELDLGLPAASVIASDDEQLARHLQHELATSHLRLYTNTDPIGTEVAGALKNVMAVAAGISDGLGLGANAKASLLCRGLAEMGVVVAGMGGQPFTLYGLAGLGDLLATANSALSRNYRFGVLLAEGCRQAEALKRVDATVEGPATARAVVDLARRHGWSLPICEEIVELLRSGDDPAQAVQNLMIREPRSESGA